MSKIVQADNINAGQYYLNGYPTHSGGGMPHTMLPVGSIIMWPTQVPPSNWLLCNGAPVPSSFPLHEMMPTRPDFRGRFPAMNGDPGASGNYIKTLKTATVNKNIDILQMPSHKHNIKFTIMTEEDPNGTATAPNNPAISTTNGFISMTGEGLNDNFAVGTGKWTQNNGWSPPSSESGNDYFYNKADIQNTGGDESYAPPYYSINFIIYAGAPTS